MLKEVLGHVRGLKVVGTLEWVVVSHTSLLMGVSILEMRRKDIKKGTLMTKSLAKK